ncbi:glycosyltransferase [Chryseobacterium sp. RR2-3-20]|uniref:glycosyltransferase n=1 Tax=Chryseobacterium sp. RR2-3-20 TaxID=2787626 RepID=UPI001AE0D373|nr:glycosyltransferase [Chryseobacterium sp. RR2-3-20]
MVEKKIKIVHIAEAFSTGIYTYLKDLTSYMIGLPNSDDFEIVIIYSKRDVLDESKIANDFSQNVRFIKVQMTRNISPKSDFKSLLKLRGILKMERPDILHLHSSKAGVLGRIAATGIVKKSHIFYSPHGYAFLRQDISPTAQKIYQLIEKYVQFFFGGTTIGSGETELEFARKIGKTYFVRNGIDFKNQKFIEDSILKNNFTVGTIGVLHAQKNPSGFNEIAQKLPEVNFIWIGDGELRNQITAPNVKITGWIGSREELLSITSTFDVYLQVSLWEGLSIAILEAMALGKPIVASNIVGNKDSVVDSKTGFLVNSMDEAVLAIKKLQDNSLRAQMGKASYKHCKEFFDKDKNFDELVKIYKRA